MHRVFEPLGLAGSADQARQFARSRRYFALGESLGGVRALVSLPGSMTHASIPAETRRARGITDTLIRLSPGIESTRALVTDVLDGLEALAVVP